ncbi:related to nuclease S1 precursor [Ramularia collo-cygni]|uniref:Related to nuclease S1 n=1 Tax=Ramularia collo-cygni TaxID=112498 RepID=A0A2D3V2J1_9PEZI|nr:related to nuclease S1 precursor [Ramularia collo-cygni]CZT22038.1 related to nuclease S1 precursor [Ramularia collo-cygni]
MFSSVIVALLAAHGVDAWGSLGHQTIAYIATSFVAPETQQWAQDILNDTTSSYLANVATWADSYRYTAEGAFSAPFHYIDANDDPPHSCNVDFDRDCGTSGCLVSAIANYTTRVQATKSLSRTQVNYALRWIVHFVGDITQPLHDEAFEIGGNGVNVTFAGKRTNLHATWDTSIPEQLEGGYGLAVAKKWAANLTTEITSGCYANQKSSWVAGLDIDDAKATSLGWATDANQYVCSTVMPNGADVLRSGDLYPQYYNSAVDTVELQIAKGGYRLAKYLDAIAAAKDISKRELRFVMPREDLSGEYLLPGGEMTPAQLRRAAVGGYNCKH